MARGRSRPWTIRPSCWERVRPGRAANGCRRGRMIRCTIRNRPPGCSASSRASPPGAIRSTRGWAAIRCAVSGRIRCCPGWIGGATPTRPIQSSRRHRPSCARTRTLRDKSGPKVLPAYGLKAEPCPTTGGASGQWSWPMTVDIRLSRPSVASRKPLACFTSCGSMPSGSRAAVRGAHSDARHRSRPDAARITGTARRPRLPRRCASSPRPGAGRW